jgi:hypothetical protein
VIVAIYQFTVASSLVVQAHYGSVEAHLFVGAVRTIWPDRSCGDLANA